MQNCQPHTLENILSKPRLTSYTGYFQTKSHDEVVGIYLWNGALAAHFSTLLGYLEIALRNKIHKALTHAHNTGNWFTKVTLDKESLSKLDRIRYDGFGKSRKLRVPAPSPDEIVSKLSFGFWTSVLSSLGTWSGTVIPAIFPNHQLSQTPLAWGTAKSRKAAMQFLYELKSFRNRIAHHEPIWKFAAHMDTSVNPAQVIFPATQNLADSLLRLRRILKHLDDAFLALDQDYYHDLLQSECRQQIDRLLTLDGFNRYKRYKNIPGPAVTPADFRKRFSLVVKGNRPVLIKLGDKRGVFIPD